MNLLSINVAKPKEVEWQGQKILTGIFKEPLPSDSPVWMRRLNIDGDGQADLRVHGGVDKAVYAYSADSFPWWEKALGRPVGAAAFGENLTFSELTETQIFVGDIFRLGAAEIQAVQPRMPCSKLGVKFGDMGVLRTFFQSRRPGIYFRVLNEGQIQVGQKLELLHQDPEKVPIATLFEIYGGQLTDQAILKKVIAAKSINEDWRRIVGKRLA